MPAVSAATGKARSSGSALPIALFSIPLGLAGLGGVWEAAARCLGVTSAPADLAYAASAVVWATFTGMYVVGAIRRDSGGFSVDLRHPLFGPFTAYIPVIAILLIAHYAPSLGDAAFWLVCAAVVVLAINAAALVAHWLGAPLEQDAMHPGYFLPVVAGPFIASIGLAAVGSRSAAIAFSASERTSGCFWAPSSPVACSSGRRCRSRSSRCCPSCCRRREQPARRGS